MSFRGPGNQNKEIQLQHGETQVPANRQISCTLPIHIRTEHVRSTGVEVFGENVYIAGDSANVAEVVEDAVAF